MATYFHGNSEIPGDHGLQTLILMNPSYVGYSDTNPQQQQQQQQQHHHHQPPPGNFVFLNSAAAGNSFNPQNLPHAPPNQTQQFVGIPLQAVTSAAGSAYSQDISALHGFNMYSSIDPTAARDIPRAPQGLSLSLSSQQTMHGSAPTIPPGTGEDIRVSGGSPSSASGISNGVNGVQSVLLGSKYLKAAQELLDEVVNVGKGVKNELTKGMNGQSKTPGESSATAVAGESGGGGETSGKRYGELTTAERQEIQMKKAKLVNMLDEVEQRYRQYHHQIQIVISWFEQAAGNGSAKTYTALALQTISKQFRCLKDAITGQIRSSSKSLGEEDCFGAGRNEGSRLKFVDHQLRQQRALQQLGMMQPNAWRPQRGLPERSVSVLRAWLFEHFLHPYPKDSDKVMLAKQTGLTRSQVSNWFINARVRLWKPMVEEMYMEEVKEQEHNGSEDNKTSRSENNENSPSKSNPAQNTSPVTENQNRAFMSKQNNPTNHNTSPSSISVSTTSPSHTGLNIRSQPGFTLIGSPEIEGVTLRSPKKQRSSEFLQSNEQVPMKFDDERQGRDGFAFMGGPANFIGGFGSYPIGEIGRFGGEQFPGTYSGNGVSLTLGLPHCESLSMPGTHQNFLTNQTIQMGRRVEIGETNEFGAMNTSTSSHSTDVYENINLQNRKRFAAPLLPDFVA